MSTLATTEQKTVGPATLNAGISLRLVIGLVGILIGAIAAGLNNRVGMLALTDLQGQYGFGHDEFSWLGTVYSAGELIAMPFSAWFAVTLSLRRFHLSMLVLSVLLAAVLPFIHRLDLLLAVRFIQGVSSGTLIPMLMMSALKYLPPAIRLHGLALYALTATFSPNIALWLTGQWTDIVADWRWVYWQMIPLALFAYVCVWWGFDKEPVNWARFRQGNWAGMAFCIPALGLITLALDQGNRLDWFNSPLITTSLACGTLSFFAWLLTEWYHPAPFLKFQLVVERRNLALGLTSFVFLLTVMLSGLSLPVGWLDRYQEYRAIQSAPLALMIALPQPILGSLVALLLYRKWVDARIVFSLGLVFIAIACWLGAGLTSEWMWYEFTGSQILQSVGQPMAVVAMLFLITSVVRPPEGPYVSGTVNTVRSFGTLLGSSLITHFITVRGRFHTEMLINESASSHALLPHSESVETLGSVISTQSFVLATADAYRLLGVLAILMIPLVLAMTFIPAPATSNNAPNIPNG